VMLKAVDVVFAAAGVTDSQLPPDVLVVNESAAPATDVVNVTG
jgi:hypothetical protein